MPCVLLSFHSLYHSFLHLFCYFYAIAILLGRKRPSRPSSFHVETWEFLILLNGGVLQKTMGSWKCSALCKNQVQFGTLQRLWWLKPGWTVQWTLFLVRKWLYPTPVSKLKRAKWSWRRLWLVLGTCRWESRQSTCCSGMVPIPLSPFSWIPPKWQASKSKIACFEQWSSSVVVALEGLLTLRNRKFGLGEASPVQVLICTGRSSIHLSHLPLT